MAHRPQNASGAAATATGSISCKVRRANCTIALTFANASAVYADVNVRHGEDYVQTMRVPAHARVKARIGLSPLAPPATIIIDVSCDGLTLRVEARPPAPVEPGDLWELVRLAGLAACAASVFAGLLAVIVGTFVLRRKRNACEREPASVEPPRVEHRVAAEPDDFQPDEEFLTDVVIPAPLMLAEPLPHVLMPEPARVYLERGGPGMTYEVPLAARRGKGALSAIAAVCAVGIVAGGFMLGHPHVAELGAPNAVLQGSAIDVAYASSGLGDLQYRVTSGSGSVIAAGDLPNRNGSVHIAVPSEAHDDTYRVRITLTGALGDASNEATIAARAVPQPRVITRISMPPVVRSFAVARSSGEAAPEVIAFYDVAADRGTLHMIDARGIRYGAAVIGPGGQARFPLPAGIDPGTLAVELHIERAGVASDSRIALPPDAKGISAAAKPVRTDGAPIAVAATASGPGPIRVRIVHHYTDLHLALVDENERKIVGLVVARGRGVVSLAHPPVLAATRMTVRATYRMANESDMVIRPVLLLPASGG